jgi:hypothetical protein
VQRNPITDRAVEAAKGAGLVVGGPAWYYHSASGHLMLGSEDSRPVGCFGYRWVEFSPGELPPTLTILPDWQIDIAGSVGAPSRPACRSALMTE